MSALTQPCLHRHAFVGLLLAKPFLINHKNLAFGLQSPFAQAIFNLLVRQVMKILTLAILSLLLIVPATAQTAVQTGPTPASANQSKRQIIVSLEDRKLALLVDGQVQKIYPVAVGKPSTPSPVGTFTIVRRAANPVYRHDGKTIQPGPRNPVGTRWMGLSIAGYGIHGTNEPNSIGKAASHGCIRMARADLEQFYDLVQVGDTVELVGERNEQTARLFGDGQTPAATPQQTVAANPAPDTVGQNKRQAEPVLLAAR